MKLWKSPSDHRTEQNAARLRDATRPPAFLALAMCIVASGGCVTQGTHEKVVSERDQLAGEKRALERRVELLEAARTSLDTERVDLLETSDKLAAERDDLREREQRQRARIESLRKELKSSKAEIISQGAELEVQREEVSRLRGTYESLVEELESEVEAGRIEIEQAREGIRLKVSDDILFASGSATLSQQGSSVLRNVAKQLKANDYLIEVQGHTDNVPLSSRARFESNWELSGARAAAVVRLLRGAGVSGERLSAVARAEFDPVASNGTPEGRARNRRIEIRLRAAEPIPTGAALDGERAIPSPGSARQSS